MIMVSSWDKSCFSLYITISAWSASHDDEASFLCCPHALVWVLNMHSSSLRWWWGGGAQKLVGGQALGDCIHFVLHEVSAYTVVVVPPMLTSCQDNFWMDQVASADDIGMTLHLVLNSLLSLAGVQVPDASAERGVDASGMM